MDRNTELAVMKKIADGLTRLYKKDLGRTITRSEALEKTAYLFNYKNWNVASAKAGDDVFSTQEDLGSRLPIDKQLDQLQYLKLGLDVGASLSDVIIKLKSQGGHEVAVGWGMAEEAIQQGEGLADALKRTGMFEDFVVFIAQMGGHEYKKTMELIIQQMSRRGGFSVGQGSGPARDYGKDSNPDD